MSENANTELARHAYDAINAGDVEGIKKYIHEDVVLTLPGIVPAAGIKDIVTRGLPAVLELAGGVGQFTEGTLHFALQTVLADGDRVAVLSHNTARHNEKTLDLLMIMFLRIKDDKIVEITEFPQQARDWLRFWTEG